MLQRAYASGAAGVIAASASALELEAFARADLTALLDGFVPLSAQPPLTVLLTEGLGDCATRAAILARSGSASNPCHCLAQVLFARFGGLVGREGEIPPVR